MRASNVFRWLGERAFELCHSIGFYQSDLCRTKRAAMFSAHADAINEYFIADLKV